MAQTTITHSCGHSQVHHLFGPGRDRDRKAAWLAGTLCSECYRLHQAQQREEASRKAAAVSSSLGLPTLTGTEKQIAWAETIRAAKLREVSAELAELVADGVSEALAEALRDGHVWLERQAEAKWWIDHRDEGRGELLCRAPSLVPFLAELLGQEEVDRRQAEIQARLARAAQEEAEAERQKKVWAAKDAIAARVRELITDRSCELNVWQNDTGTERRVYVDIGGRRGAKVCYYHTGNGRNRPGSLDGAGHCKADADAVRAFLAEVAAAWKCISVEVE